MLGEEFEDFLASYEKPRRRGLRVNTAKISVEEFVRSAPFHLEPIPWTENGFYYAEEDRPAQHPFYAAGLYYLQEASAMAPATMLPLEAGDRVLDLCAAPGGKATELAVRLKSLGGVLVANEIHPARAKALLHNLEKTGCDNFCVTNESPERLAARFPGFFDKILVDAPCSGEGMFRKEEDAVKLWSPERVRECAAMQKDILECANAMLRPGGKLLYSTCTFAPEEDEEQIADMLQRHQDMKLVSLPEREGFARGMSTVGENVPHTVAENCVRLWPHRIDGEGHFLALLEKAVGDFSEENEKEELPAVKEEKRARKQTGKERKRARDGQAQGMTAMSKEQEDLLRIFLCGMVGNAVGNADRPLQEVRAWQDKAFLPVLDPALLQGLHILRNGLYLGEWKKGRFEPSQSLSVVASGVKAEAETGTMGDVTTYARQYDLAADAPALQAFLRGEAISVEGEDGWTLVATEGYPVGWGKTTNGTLKNHLPAGWRNKG